MIYILFPAVLLLALYLYIRLSVLKKALGETDIQLQEIQRDLTQNQALHLPLPDRDLESLLNTINHTLEEIREERRKYIKHQREFQSQIEAVSHDLRTPLTVILGYLKLLQKQEPDNGFTDDQRAVLITITRRAQAMEKLISQFYDYSRLSASDYELTLEKIDVGRMVREVFADNCLMMEAAHLQVDTDFADHPVYVKGEAGALERILTNLLQNAGRYAESFLRISVEKDAKQVRIVLENDTCAVSPENIPFLFEPFYRNDLSRNQAGSGLGLTIAKGLAEEMGGKLEACMVNENSGGNLPAAGRCAIVRFTLCLESGFI